MGETHARAAAPLVSVVVVAPDGDGPALEATLDSLAAQTLPADQVEVVLVAAAPTRPRPGVRTLVSGPRDGRDSALATARGTWTTFVEAGDRVGREHLAAMLGAAAPGVVVLAPVRSDGQQDEPREAGEAAYRDVAAADDVAVWEEHGGKLVELSAAASTSSDPALGQGEASAYWTTLLATHRLHVRALSDRPASAYLRARHGHGDDAGRGVTRRLECLAALGAVVTEDPTVSVVVDRMRRRHGRALNRHLRRRPDDRAWLVDEAQRVAPHDVPWSLVNAGLARQLAVCYCFPPDLDTSGMVAAKRLHDAGEPTDVISMDMSATRSHDPRGLQVVGPALGRHHVVGGPMSFYSWGPVVHFVEQVLAQLDRWGDEGPGPYERVYSRAMAVSSHFAAAAVKLRHPELQWTAEFSDPLRYDTLAEERAAVMRDDHVARPLLAALSDAGHVVPPSRRMFDVAERLVYAFADRVVFTNEHQRDYMLGYCEGDPVLVARARSVSEVWPHPVPAPELYDVARPELPLEPGRLHLAYFGVFYENRDLSVVLDAIAGLDLRDRARVALHVFTPRPHPLVVQATRRGLADVVRARPYVDYFDYLALTRRFDVLLVNDAATSAHHDLNPYVPSKMADYVGSGTPIWVLHEPGSVLSRQPAAHHSALGDVDAAGAVLRALLDTAARAG